MPIRRGVASLARRRFPASFVALAKATPLLVALCLVPGCGRSSADEEAHVCAAASLRTVLPELIDAFHSDGRNGSIVATYASSGTLRRQVEAGAPAAGVLFASALHVDKLIDAGIALRSSRVILARNALVLVTADDMFQSTFRTIHRLGSDQRLAMGDPAFVPAGRYARDALRALGHWQSMKDRVILAQDVSGVVTYVRRQEAQVGIAYDTDVASMASIRVLDRAIGEWAPKPAYVGAAIAGSDHTERMVEFLEFLLSDAARPIWTEHGFAAP